MAIRLPTGVAKWLSHVQTTARPAMTLEEAAVRDALDSIGERVGRNGAFPQELIDAASAKSQFGAYTEPHDRREFFRKALQLPARGERMRAMRSSADISRLSEFDLEGRAEWLDWLREDAANRRVDPNTHPALVEENLIQRAFASDPTNFNFEDPTVGRQIDHFYDEVAPATSRMIDDLKAQLETVGPVAPEPEAPQAVTQPLDSLLRRFGVRK